MICITVPVGCSSRPTVDTFGCSTPVGQDIKKLPNCPQRTYGERRGPSKDAVKRLRRMIRVAEDGFKAKADEAELEQRSDKKRADGLRELQAAKAKLETYRTSETLEFFLEHFPAFPCSDPGAPRMVRLSRPEEKKLEEAIAHFDAGLRCVAELEDDMSKNLASELKAAREAVHGQKAFERRSGEHQLYCCAC